MEPTLTKRFDLVHQQGELVEAMLLHLNQTSRTNRSSQVLYQELDSIPKFVVTLAFPS